MRLEVVLLSVRKSPLKCSICGKKLPPLKTRYCSPECTRLGKIKWQRHSIAYIRYCYGCGQAFESKSKAKILFCQECLDNQPDKICTCCGRRRVAPGFRCLCVACYRTDGNPIEFFSPKRSQKTYEDPEIISLQELKEIEENGESEVDYEDIPF